MTVENLIEKGPSSKEEVQQAVEGVKEQASEFSQTESIEDKLPVKDVLKAFETLTGETKEQLEKEEAEAEEPEEKEEEEPRDAIEREKPENKVSSNPPTARSKTTPLEEYASLVPENVVPLFKKMSNDAREWMVAELKRNKEKIAELESKSGGDSKLPHGWYEHEAGYKLLPQYQQIDGARTQVKAIQEHFRKQLIAIKEGEDWFDLIPDGKGGIEQVKRKADAASDVNVQSRIQESFSILESLNRKENEIVDSFKSNAFNHRTGVKKLEDEYFPQYSDEKENEKNPHLKSIKNIFKANGLDSDRMSGFTAKLYAFAMETLAEKEELEKSKATPAAKNPNGPTGDEINTGKTTSKPKNLDDMPFMAAEFEKYHS